MWSSTYTYMGFHSRSVLITSPWWQYSVQSPSLHQPELRGGSYTWSSSSTIWCIFGAKKCGRSSQPSTCWPNAKRRDERNRRFCLQRGSRGHASCINAKASRSCLSRRHNLAASAPSYYDRSLEPFVGDCLKSGARRTVGDWAGGVESWPYCHAHEGHQGMVRTKARLREKVWWPGVDKQVEEVVRACHPWQLVRARAKPEPLKSTKLPEGPWKEISVDLLHVSSGEHLLVVVDCYSRWKEAIHLKKKRRQPRG